MKRSYLLYSGLLFLFTITGHSASVDSGYEASKEVSGNCPTGASKASRYNFIACNCTDYVAYWLNSLLDQHSATKPMFTNRYYGYSWGDAYQWKDSVSHGVPGYTSRYPIEAFNRDGTDQWKIGTNGEPYNTTIVVAYWNRKDPSNPDDVGHVARTKKVQSDHTVTVAEYNWSTAHAYGERTLHSDDSGYPDGFLYIATDSFFECDLMGNICMGSGKPDGSGGSPSTTPTGPNPVPISGKRADLRPDFDIYDTDGHEISSNCDDCSGKAVDVGQHVRPKLWTQVNNNADAGKWKRNSSSDTIEGPVWWRIEGKTNWTLLGSGEYTIGKLDKGDKISETHDFNIPNYPGDIIQWKACVDGDDEIYEEKEGSSKRKITNPDQSGTTNNCSRTERNYIRIPNYTPTGSVDRGDCNGFSGWAKDQNTSDPIRIHIYANGAFTGQPLANQYRSDVGSHAFTWVTPESFKDGSVKNITFYVVDVPDGTETPIGSRTLVCSPPARYDLATTATWIDGEYTLSVGSVVTIRSVVQNLGSNIPRDATVTSTLIHQGGTQYPMGSVTIPAGNLLSGWDADASISATAPSQEGRYQLKTCVTANLQETDEASNCLEVDGPFMPPHPVHNGLSDDEETAIWIINHSRRRNRSR